MDGGEREALLGRARGGDERALGSLLQSLRVYVRAVVRGACGGRAGAEESDLIQDVMLQATRGFAGFRGTAPAEFVGWLRQIAVRVTRHSLRGVAVREQTGTAEWADDLACGAPDPADRAIQQEQSVAVAAALAALPEELQQVLLDRFVDQLDHAAIAGRMGRSVGAVRMLYLRALRRFRDAYRE